MANLYVVSVGRVIDTPLDRIWKAITDPADLDEWFSAKTSIELKVGGRMRNEDGDNWLIESFSPLQHIAFGWENENPYRGSRLRFDLEPHDPAMVLRFTQSGLKRLEDAQSQLEGWSWALHSLDSWLRNGKRVRYAQWEAAGKP